MFKLSAMWIQRDPSDPSGPFSPAKGGAHLPEGTEKGVRPRMPRRFDKGLVHCSKNCRKSGMGLVVKGLFWNILDTFTL